MRRLQCAAFNRGERPVLVSTDAIGMGVNLPIQRILFTEISKFDGEEIRPLTSQEVKQIAGRAGRLGIYDVGYVGSTGGGQAFLEAQLESADSPVEQAIVGPSEAILSIGLLPLREKLALWSTREEALPYYRKMDVRDQLLVLDRIALLPPAGEDPVAADHAALRRAQRTEDAAIPLLRGGVLCAARKCTAKNP